MNCKNFVSHCRYDRYESHTTWSRCCQEGEPPQAVLQEVQEQLQVGLEQHETSKMHFFFIFFHCLVRVKAVKRGLHEWQEERISKEWHGDGYWPGPDHMAHFAQIFCGSKPMRWLLNRMAAGPWPGFTLRLEAYPKGKHLWRSVGDIWRTQNGMKWRDVV